MIIYENDKAGFLKDAFTCDIEDVVHSQFHERTGRKVAKGEFRSWRDSLMAVAKVVNVQIRDEERRSEKGVRKPTDG